MRPDYRRLEAAARAGLARTPSEEPGSADEALIGSSRRELPLAETAYSSAVPPKGIPGFRREEVERIGHPASLRLFPWPTKPIFLPSGPAVPWGSACCAPWALNTGRMTTFNRAVRLFWLRGFAAF